MAKKEIKYLAQDFESFNASYQNFIKSYYPTTWRDFHEASTGQVLLDVLAYSSDLLSFYINRVYNEILFDNAVEKESIYSMARTLGYKPSKKAASLVEPTWYVEVPATYESGIALPDYRYAPIIKKGSTALAMNGTKFENIYDIDFSLSTGSNDFAPSRINTSTSTVEYFAVKKSVLAISAITKKKTLNINDFIKFRKLIIDDADSIDIVDVLDSNGNKWYEVDYLAKDTVFEAISNNNSDKSLVPYVMKLRKVPRRFVTEFDYKTGYISLNFGSGKEDSDESSIFPNTSEMSIPLYGKTYFSSFTIDPQNFLNTKTLGLSPYNTTLNVFYRAGGGASSIVSANSINKSDNVLYEFKYTNLDNNKKTKVINSISVNNEAPSQGGRDEQTVYEIKQFAKAHFAAQERCITKEDYISRIFSMPSIFGSVCKASVLKNCRTSNVIEVIVLTYDENKNYSVPTEILQKNLKTYLRKYIPINANVYIRPAEVIKFNINFVVVATESSNRNAILSQCMNFLKGYFNKDSWQIGQPIVKSDIISGLQDIENVYSVSEVNIEFENSKDIFERNGIIYCPDYSIFEIENFMNIEGSAL